MNEIVPHFIVNDNKKRFTIFLYLYPKFSFSKKIFCDEIGKYCTIVWKEG